MAVSIARFSPRRKFRGIAHHHIRRAAPGAQRSLMLCFAGFSRFASDIAKDEIEVLGSREAQLMAMRKMVDSALEVLVDERRRCASSARLCRNPRSSNTGWPTAFPTADRRNLRGRARRRRRRRQVAGCRRRRIYGVYAEPRRRRVRERLNKSRLGRSDDDGSKIVPYQPDGL